MNIKKVLFLSALSSAVGASPAFAKPVFTKSGRSCGQFQKPGVCQQEDEEAREACIEEVIEHNRRVAECLRNRHGVNPDTFDLLFSSEE